MASTGEAETTDLGLLRVPVDLRGYHRPCSLPPHCILQEGSQPNLGFFFGAEGQHAGSAVSPDLVALVRMSQAQYVFESESEILVEPPGRNVLQWFLGVRGARPKSSPYSRPHMAGSFRR